jgi:hypothetical protein
MNHVDQEVKADPPPGNHYRHASRAVMHDSLNHRANTGNVRAFAARDQPKDDSKNKEC